MPYYDQSFYNYISRDLVNVSYGPATPYVVEAYGRTVQEIMQVFFMGVNYAVHFASYNTFDVLVMLQLEMTSGNQAYSKLVQLSPFTFTYDYWTTGGVQHYLVTRVV